MNKKNKKINMLKNEILNKNNNNTENKKNHFMNDNDNEENKKSEVYVCEICDYITVRVSHRKRHEMTRKHKLLVIEKNRQCNHKQANANCELNKSSYLESTQTEFKEKGDIEKIKEKKNTHYCVCGKKYAYMSSLCFHRKTCKVLIKNIKNTNVTNLDIDINSDIKKYNDEIINSSESDINMHGTNIDTNKIIMKLLKDNEEMKKIIIEQNKQQTQIMMQQQQQQQQQQEQQQQIIEMLPKICIGNITNNNNTTNIKQKFNLNLFLNEQCKDAISLCDFVKSLNITFDDLNVTREKNLEESVGLIFLRGLKDLDVFKRPIHCTDTKRDIMYIKDEDIWKKDEGNEKIKSSINEISRKHVKVLKELKDSDPEIKTNELKRDDFILTMNHVCTPIPDSGEKRIIKTISKEVTVS
jgi:hypothetical protein